MNLTMILNNGMKFHATVEKFNAVELATSLNSQNIQSMNIGDVVVSKHVLMAIIPESSSEGNIVLYLSNGISYDLDVENYDAVGFSNDINNMQKQMIPLGNAVVNKNSFMMVVPSANIPTE